MKLAHFFAFGFFTLATACASSDGTPDAPVIDSLDVPEKTTTMTLNGQTGPGMIVALSAHDDSAGINALHVVFTETKVDQAIAIPGSPTTITDQKFQLIALHAPSGPHSIEFRLTNVKGTSSPVITKVVTVP
jgi:hypothetical protein